MSWKKSWLQSYYRGNFRGTFVSEEKCPRNNDLTAAPQTDASEKAITKVTSVSEELSPQNVFNFFIKNIIIFLCAKTFEFQIFKIPPIFFKFQKSAIFIFKFQTTQHSNNIILLIFHYFHTCRNLLFSFSQILHQLHNT